MLDYRSVSRKILGNEQNSIDTLFVWWRNNHKQNTMSKINDMTPTPNWLVVSTHLKNMNQIGNLPQIGVKIKNILNHHLANKWTGFFMASLAHLSLQIGLLTSHGELFAPSPEFLGPNVKSIQLHVTMWAMEKKLLLSIDILVFLNTPRKINMKPENTPLEKLNHLLNHRFRVLC